MTILTTEMSTHGNIWTGGGSGRCENIAESCVDRQGEAVHYDPGKDSVDIGVEFSGDGFADAGDLFEIVSCRHVSLHFLGDDAEDLLFPLLQEAAEVRQAEGVERDYEYELYCREEEVRRRRGQPTGAREQPSHHRGQEYRSYRYRKERMGDDEQDAGQCGQFRRPQRPGRDAARKQRRDEVSERAQQQEGGRELQAGGQDDEP